jgi:hypothetical protein
MSPRSIEDIRDDSHSMDYRMRIRRREFPQTKEFDPYSGSMENRSHFEKFLNAILANEDKSVNFLKKMPESRKDELKRIHANSGLALRILDSF